MTGKTSRENEMRDKLARRKPWAPPQRLEAPKAPPGFAHRWLRTSIRGADDNINIHAKFREGWEPVRADEYPNEHVPAIEDGVHAGVIGTGGLMLARIPEETVRERSAYYGTRTREQMDAVDQDLMKENHPDMPIQNDRKSEVTFGGRERDSE